jgi:hypothetical protein
MQSHLSTIIPVYIVGYLPGLYPCRRPPTQPSPPLKKRGEGGLAGRYRVKQSLTELAVGQM